MTREHLETLLASSEITTNIGNTNAFGYGLINAQKAVLAAQTAVGPPDPPDPPETPTLLSVTPVVLNLGFSLSTVTITAEKTGDIDGSITVTGTSTDIPWLEIVPDAVDVDGLGTYTVTAHRSGLADGTHKGIITFTSSENTVVVNVSIQASTAPTHVDAGFHYVELLDINTGVEEL